MATYEHKYYKQSKGSACMKFFSALLSVAGIGVMALVISLVWNTVVPTVFNLPGITYWQAYLFYLLTYLLVFIQRPHSGAANYSKEVMKQ